MEHVFGKLKAWMGAAPFLMKWLENVWIEMSLTILAYSMKRMVRLFGTTRLVEAVRA